MKGFVPTPPHLVDQMVAKLFRDRPPAATDRLLDPGCGSGAFIAGVLRWCEKARAEVPTIVGIESDPKLFSEAKLAVGGSRRVELRNEDFLSAQRGTFDFVVGNPPYVPITGLTIQERDYYRRNFETAVGRFDLYLLFFEQALGMLRQSGRLVFVTPEKFLYTQTARPLRKRLAAYRVKEIHLIPETAFGELTTYPTITTVVARPPNGETRIVLRDGTTISVELAAHGEPWLAEAYETRLPESRHRLQDAFARISCGVATGADGVFVVKNSQLPSALRSFAYPTVSGRSIAIGRGPSITHSMLVPYDASGTLLEEDSLGALGDYLSSADKKSILLQRTCASRKPWYAFHENPPLPEMLRPKILCKDIGLRPWFVVDESGELMPRHSVYYMVPEQPTLIHDLCDYLNSKSASLWLLANCQRAANGFIRLQSHVLKRMPIPADLVSAQFASV